MNKTTVTLIIVIVLLAAGVKLISDKANVVPEAGTSVKNISVKIGNEVFDLINGKAEKEVALGSATKNKTIIFGEPVIGDLDKDGDSDAAILLQNEPGGSGTFYYAVLAINNNGSYKATETMFLGDRIAPQTLKVKDGRAVYNIAERRAGESFTVPPSVGKTVWVHYDAKTNQIGEWVKDFEGETGTTKIFYKNDNYSFFINLPDSWAGYKVLESNWQGFDTNSTYEKPAPTETGPVISIRHPLWTEKTPRQDIPIMVFTLSQWEKVTSENLSVSAAPIPPTELGRNTKYVFAIPARYNYAFSVGHEDVDQIIKGNYFHTF